MSTNAAPRPIRILLIDDSPSDRELTAYAMKRIKFCNDVLVAEDGEEALAVLADADPTPDLILLDLNMPGMDGHEFLGHIKAHPSLRTIPVIVLTSSAADEDVTQAYSNHCAGYVRKPLDLAGLTRIVRAIEDYWFAIVERPRTSN